MATPEQTRRTEPAPLGAPDPTSQSQADTEALAQAKSVLRAAIRQRRAARGVEERAVDDHARTAHLLEFLEPHLTPEWTTACYFSVPPEPATLELIVALAARSRVLLPVLRTGAPKRRPAPDWAVYTDPDALVTGRRGIPEPGGEPLGPAALAEADVVVCSALALTPAGERLGLGGGWFDEALTHAREDAVLVALVNSDEVLPSLPTHPWDRPVHVLATPAGLRSAG